LRLKSPSSDLGGLVARIFRHALKEIHNHKPDHPGILVVYQDNDPARDTSYREIIQAIANLESTDVTIAGGFWPLNVYRW